MKVIELNGIRRSGIHAIAFWMMERLSNCILINNADCLRDHMFEVFTSHDEMQLLAGFEITNVLKSKQNVILVREDQSPENLQKTLVSLVPNADYQRALILRDHYNTLASRWAAYVEKEHKEPTLIGDQFLELYLQYAAEIQDQTSYLPGHVFLSYSRWLTDNEYRQDLLKIFGLTGSSNRLDYLTRFGSSFEGETNNPESLTTRWKTFQDNEIFRTYCSDPRLVAITQRLFNEPLPASLRTDATVQKLVRPEKPKPSTRPVSKGRHRIVVFSAFKTGSRAMEATLRKGLPDTEYEVLHEHNQSLCPLEYNDLIIPIRRHADIYKSAYFQDITFSAGYPYSLCFGMPGPPLNDFAMPTTEEMKRKREKVLNTPIPEIIGHFMSFPWQTYSWLNLNETLRWVRIAHDPFITPQLEYPGYQILRATKKSSGAEVTIMFISSHLLRDIDMTKAILAKINLHIKLNKPVSVNEGRTKWYSEVYRRFQEQLPSDFNTQYANLDEPFLY